MAKLYIENRAEFDEAVWQTPSGFSDEQYNQWLRNAVDILTRIMNEVEDSDETSIRQSEIYMMGDIINMLSAIRIESEARPILVASIDDFCGRGYNVRKLPVEEQDSILERMYDTVGESTNVMDCFWDGVEDIAEDLGIEQEPVFDDDSHDEHDDDELVSALLQYIAENLSELDHALGMEAWGNKEPIPDRVAGRVHSLAEDFCLDNDLDDEWWFDNVGDVDEIFTLLPDVKRKGVRL